MLRAAPTHPARACRIVRSSAPLPSPVPPSRYADLAAAIDAFLGDLRFDGRARWTRRKHEQELRRLADWFTMERLDWRRVAAHDLSAYLRTRAQLGASARAASVCSLRRFYRWLAEQGEIAASPAATLKIPPRAKQPPKALSKGQVRTLLDALAASARPMAQRDEALIVVMIYTGLRAGEVARLRWRDYDADAGLLTIWEAKANKGRVVTVHPSAACTLARWRAAQQGGTNDPIFDHEGKALTPARVGKIARRASRRSGVPFTAHVLRHTFATWAYRESRDLYAVSKALGHSELKTTEIYVHADAESMRPALDKLPDIGAW